MYLNPEESTRLGRNPPGPKLTNREFFSAYKQLLG